MENRKLLSKQQQVKTKSNYRRNLLLIKRQTKKLEISGEDIILIGAGPSLKKSLKWLKKMLLKYPEFITIVMDAAYKFCIENGVHVDYVGTVEFKDDLGFWDECEGSTFNKTLIAYAGAGNSVTTWKGKSVFYDINYEQKNMRLHHGKKMRHCPTGFTVFNTMIGLCYIEGARSIIMLGNDLWFPSRKKMYSDKRYLSAVRKKIKVILYKGKRTTGDYYNACIWFARNSRKLEEAMTVIDASDSIIEDITKRSIKELYKIMNRTIFKFKLLELKYQITKTLKRFFIRRVYQTIGIRHVRTIKKYARIIKNSLHLKSKGKTLKLIDKQDNNK